MDKEKNEALTTETLIAAQAIQDKCNRYLRTMQQQCQLRMQPFDPDQARHAYYLLLIAELQIKVAKLTANEPEPESEQNEFPDPFLKSTAPKGDKN